jgi:hypothetical protein
LNIQLYKDLMADVRWDGRYHAIRALVQPDDPQVKEIAAVLVQAPDLISAAQEFVNNFTTYQREPGDFWRTPAETLARKAGDCDDKAILLTSLLRSGGMGPLDVYCAFGLWDINGHAEGHMFVVTAGQGGQDRIIESTAAPSKPISGNYTLQAIFNDQYTFATSAGLREFDLQPVHYALVG